MQKLSGARGKPAGPEREEVREEEEDTDNGIEDQSSSCGTIDASLCIGNAQSVTVCLRLARID
jgi:hypothetical protein